VLTTVEKSYKCYSNGAYLSNLLFLNKSNLYLCMGQYKFYCPGTKRVIQWNTVDAMGIAGLHTDNPLRRIGPIDAAPATLADAAAPDRSPDLDHGVVNLLVGQPRVVASLPVDNFAAAEHLVVGALLDGQTAQRGRIMRTSTSPDRRI